MKKIINGKMYNTETATFLLSHENGLGTRDFRNFWENLYRKKTGEFFLYGEGGPMTAYAKTYDGNSWSSGEDIIPLSIEEAKEWVEKNCSADDFEEIFGKVEE
jgi:hypothetical protein